MKENKEYQEKKEQEKVVHEPTGSYGMDTITMRQKIMERVMLMEENQLKEMLRFSNELEQKSWFRRLLVSATLQHQPHTLV